MPKYLGVGRYTSDGLNGLAREGVSRRRATPLSLRERTRPGLGPKFFARLPAATSGILGVAVVAGQPTSATAQSYPWCAQLWQESYGTVTNDADFHFICEFFRFLKRCCREATSRIQDALAIPLI